MSRYKIGMLYDTRVMNHPIVGQVMWWYATGAQFLIRTTDPEPQLEKYIAAEWKRFPEFCQAVAEPPQFVDQLPLEELDGLIVIRSHPEMFGPQIMAVRYRNPDLGVDVWTIETTRNNALEPTP